MKVGVLDYGVGNLGSVLRALEELRATAMLIDRAVDMHAADCLLLPGVGSFTECKSRLDRDGWTPAIQAEVKEFNKPLLGICLGMQLLASSGLEGADSDTAATAGLGLIPGQVRSLTSLGCHDRVPHMGWNSITIENPNSLMQGIASGTDFYFVHSYAFVADESTDVLAMTDYGTSFASVVGRGKVWGTQFHPEKSSRAGFRVLRNFLEGSTC